MRALLIVLVALNAVGVALWQSGATLPPAWLAAAQARIHGGGEPERLARQRDPSNILPRHDLLEAMRDQDAAAIGGK